MSVFERIDIFISRKSEDARLAKKMYDYFTARGLVVFESDHLLYSEGVSDYGKAIDDALNSTKHFIVLASRTEYFNAPWVDSEWRYYMNRLRMGQASGNLLVMITAGMPLKTIPPALQHRQVFYYEDSPEVFDKMLPYVTPADGSEITPPPINYFQRLWFRFLKISRRLRLKIAALILAVSLLTLLLVDIYRKKQPFDATFFVHPQAGLSLLEGYPGLKNAQLTIFLGDKTETRNIDEKGEVSFRDILPGFHGSRVPVRFTAEKWAAFQDTVTLKSHVDFPVLPDGSMGTITGTVTYNQKPIAEALIIVNTNDTSCYTDQHGFFRLSLPFHLQADNYELSVQKTGFLPYRATYFPRSGKTDIVLAPAR